MKEDCGNVFNIPLFDVRICLLSLGGMRFVILCPCGRVLVLWQCCGPCRRDNKMNMEYQEMRRKVKFN